MPYPKIDKFKDSFLNQIKYNFSPKINDNVIY